MTSKPSKILINGWYGHANAGDDAILDVFVSQTKARSNCDIRVLSERPANVDQAGVSVAHHPALSQGFLGHLFSGRLFRHLQQVAWCDLFVLGGGGLLRDNTSWRNMFRLLDEIWLAKLWGRKVMLYAIGVGPFRTRLGKFIIGRSARLCDLITVRSVRCAQLLQELGVDEHKIHVVSDPAFMLEPEQPDDPELIALLASKRYIGVFPTVTLVEEIPDPGHIQRLAEALDQLAEQQGLSFIALPMRVDDGGDNGVDDVVVSQRIRAHMKHPEALHVYTKQLKPRELKWACSQMTMNITVRLHALIFSLGSHVPAVAINYEPKVANVFSEFRQPQYLVQLDEQLGTALPATVTDCLGNLAAYTEAIRTQMPVSYAAAAETFRLMDTVQTPETEVAAVVRR